MNIRIGAVPFGVGAPLVAGLDARPEVQLVSDVPSRLITRLRARDLDAALVSSIEAFRTPGYRALATIGICCNGPVRSVRAFRTPETELRTVGLDDASETSSALLRVLLDRREPEARPTFERVATTTRPDDLPHDLVMMIGDAGLHADPGTRDAWDLGELWRDETGLPFVFALWLIAPHAPTEAIASILHSAHARGQATACADGTAGAVHYEIGPGERRGLELFHREAARLGLAEPAIAPTFVGASRTTENT